MIQLTPLLGYPMHFQSMLHIRYSILPAYPSNACRCWKRLGPFPTLSCSTGPLLQASGRDPGLVLPPGLPFLGEPCWSMLCQLGSTPRTEGRTNGVTHTHKFVETLTRTPTNLRRKAPVKETRKLRLLPFFNLFLRLDKLIVVNF